MTDRPPATSGELTDAAYWDAAWAKESPVDRLSPLDPSFGGNGTFMRMVRRQLGDLTGQRLLEMGVGTNYRLLALNQWAGAKVTAIGYSPVGLQVLREVFRRPGSTVEAILGDFLRDVLPRRDYDVIVHWGVLEHFTDPIPLLRACRGAVRSGGSVLFTMPNLESWAARGWAKFSPNN